MQKSLAALLLLRSMPLRQGGVAFIVGAIVREGNLEGGEAPSDSRNRRARRAMVITAVLVTVLLFLGKAWWGVNAADFHCRGWIFSSLRPPR